MKVGKFKDLNKQIEIIELFTNIEKKMDEIKLDLKSCLVSGVQVQRLNKIDENQETIQEKLDQIKALLAYDRTNNYQPKTGHGDKINP